MVVWESPVDDEVAALYIIDSFTGRHPVVDYILTGTSPQLRDSESQWNDGEDIRVLRGRL